MAPKAELGTTGLSISRVGLGAWAIGGEGWGGQDDADSIAAIRRAVECGVNWIDTAAVYGLGHSEEVVARALRELPEDERPLVFTKGGLVFDGRRGGVVHNLEPGSLRAECEASLRRLGVERIDLYQLHWPDEGTPVEESWGAVGDLIDEGKARFGGVSNFDGELLARCERVRHVDSLQPPLSVIARGALDDAIPAAAGNGTGVIAYSPLQSGLLSGSFSAARAKSLPEEDWRSGDAEFRPPRLERNLDLVERLRPIAAGLGCDVAELAIAWVLAQPGVTGAIVGARCPEQVDGWVGAADIELSAADLDAIASAIEATHAGVGPTG